MIGVESILVSNRPSDALKKILLCHRLQSVQPH
jgi:hypothetical protein